jgi:predicted O-methyltransferase YrrM
MKKMVLLLTLFIASFSSMQAQYEADDLKEYVDKVLPALEGWCSYEKACSFIDLVLEVKPEIYVEIGVFGGKSLFPVAAALKHLNHGIIIGIDPWDKFESVKNFDPVEDEVHFKWWSSINMNFIYYSYLNMLRRQDVSKFVVTLKMTSEKAVKEIETIDILYMDGNHGKGAAKQDVELYLPKVRTGGYIWFNDALSKHRQDAVLELSLACTKVKAIDNGNCILFKKK